MRVADALQGIVTLGLDAAPIIYFVENTPVFYDLCVLFFTAIGSGQIDSITSSLIYAETLVMPLRNSDSALTQLFRNLLSATQGLTTLPVSIELAEKAADLRARYRLRTADAIHVATAIDAGCDAFLTNDTGLLRVAEIRVIVIGELVL